MFILLGGQTCGIQVLQRSGGQLQEVGLTESWRGKSSPFTNAEVFPFPRHPNTCWEGIWTPETYPKNTKPQEVFGFLGSVLLAYERVKRFKQYWCYTVRYPMQCYWRLTAMLEKLQLEHARKFRSIRDGYVWHHVWPSKALKLSFGNCYSQTLETCPLTFDFNLMAGQPTLPQPYWRLINHWFPFNKASLNPCFWGGTLGGGVGWPAITTDFFVGVVDLGFHPIFDHIGLKIQEGAYHVFHLWYLYFTYTQILISSSFKKMEIFRIFSFNMKWILRVYLWFDPTPYTAVLPPFFYRNALEFILRNYRADFHMCCIYFKGFGTLDRWILSEKPRVLLGDLT